MPVFDETPSVSFVVLPSVFEAWVGTFDLSSAWVESATLNTASNRVQDVSSRWVSTDRLGDFDEFLDPRWSSSTFVDAIMITILPTVRHIGTPGVLPQELLLSR